MTQQIIDSTDRLHLEVDRNMNITGGHIEAVQEIPDEFLRSIRDIKERQDQKFRKTQEEWLIASIPGAVADHWFRQGFNIFDGSVTARELQKRLIAESLTGFLATDKIAADR